MAGWCIQLITTTANISPTPVCHPTLSMSVTGGLATYDPRIAEVYHTKWGPEIAKLIRSTLRDRSIAWPVDEVGEACGASNSCEAFLLAGPYGTVSPWPFTNKTEDWDEEGFLLEKAPVYMVEMWNLENGDEVAVWGMEDDCVLYGGFDAKNEFSTLVCIVERGVDDELAAGECPRDVTTRTTMPDVSQRGTYANSGTPQMEPALNLPHYPVATAGKCMSSSIGGPPTSFSPAPISPSYPSKISPHPSRKS